MVQKLLQFGKKIVKSTILNPAFSLSLALAASAFAIIFYATSITTVKPEQTSKSSTPVVTALPTKVDKTPTKPKKTTKKTVPKVVVSPHVTTSSKHEPVVKPSPHSNVSGLTPTNTSPPTGGSGSSSSPSTTTSYTSTNWSGYIAANGSFTKVSGSWIATSPTGNGSRLSADATWIGIGGVTSDDLIQVGTSNTVSSGGVVTTSAFYEMLPAASQTIATMTVKPGDSMSASVIQTSSGHWSISITDSTSNQTFQISVSYTSTLSSAEWIEEDPSFISGRLVPFDNFGEAIFSSASTTENGRVDNLSTSTAQPVTMVDSSDQTIAQPSAIGGDGASFTVSP